jgi:tetratricopeptide (TPR) repeat protein
MPQDRRRRYWERRYPAGFLFLFLPIYCLPAHAAIPDIISDQHTRGHRYESARHPQEALTVWQNALRLSDSKLGASSQQSRCLSFDLANAYTQLKRYSDAAPLYEKLAATAVSTDSPTAHARTLVALAGNQHALSNDSGAILNYKKALSLLRGADQENPEVATILAEAHIGYAGILFNSNEQSEAERQLRTALTLIDNAPSPDSTETRRKAMETLATLLMLNGRTAEAASLKDKIIQIGSTKTTPASTSVILPEDRGSSALERLANEFLEDEEEEKPPTIPPCGCQLSNR